MFAREFYWQRFVQGIWATAPMREYCVRHRLPYLPKGSGPPTRADEWAGLAAFYALPAATRDVLEAEARRANELATPAGNAFLLEAGGDGPPRRPTCRPARPSPCGTWCTAPSCSPPPSPASARSRPAPGGWAPPRPG